VNWPVTIRPKAKADLRRAHNCYEERCPGLGDEFLADHAEDQLPALACAIQRLGHREAVGIVLNLNFPAENPFEVRFQRLAVHAERVGIFQQAGGGEMAPGVPIPNVCGAP